MNILLKSNMLLLLLAWFMQTSAQGLYPVSFDDKVDHSSLIVEGKVVAQEGFWNEGHSMIFTTNKVEVYKVFKGVPKKDTIDVITVGGTVGYSCIMADHLLTLNKGEMGVLFCRPDKQLIKSSQRKGSYEVYSSEQGFLKYDRRMQAASAPFATYDNIEKQLYRFLQTKTGRSLKSVKEIVRPKPVTAKNAFTQSSHQTLAPSITSFSPTTVTGGTLMDPTNNVLTINGTGFGPASGYAAVQFDNPNDGPGGAFTSIPYSSPLIISWSNTQIKVRVPSLAGTGLIGVVDNANILVTSGSDLTVLFNILDVNFVSSGVEYVKEVRLLDLNGSGGYNLLYSNNTANNGIDVDAGPAKPTVQRALKTWRESVGFNVTEAGADATQKIDLFDGKNMVMYDNNYPGNSHLPDGVLAICLSGYGICPNNLAVNQAYKVGLDIVIRNNGVSTGSPLDFSYGPCSAYSNNVTDIDLETVLLHEMGHAINMGHIIDARQGTAEGQSNPSKVMHFSIDRAQKRVSPDFAAMTGATYTITPKGAALGSCGAIEMTPVATVVEPKDECPSSFPSTSTPDNTTVAFDLAHTTTNKYRDPDFYQMTPNYAGLAITNTAYYAFRTNGAGGNLSLSVSGYTTDPVSAASCTMGPPNIPVTGVEMALYQVASCPVGQSFPNAAFATTFSSDCIIPVTGLAPNSNYLLAFDGIENTKAIFTLGFSGATLPIRIDEFTGMAMTGFNRVWWAADLSAKATAIQLEKSSDGIAFIRVTTSSLDGHGSFDDTDPFTGNNYYRLAVRNSDGTTVYSKVILLNNMKTSGLTVFPNPATRQLNVALDHQQPGRYSLLLYNTMGQAVWKKQVMISGDHATESVNADGFARGIYHLVVIRPQGTVLKSINVTFQ